MHQEAARISHSSSQAAPTIMYASTTGGLPSTGSETCSSSMCSSTSSLFFLCRESRTVVYCAATQATNMLFLSLENQPIRSYLYSIAIITLG
jgi:hypothetical protein